MIDRHFVKLFSVQRREMFAMVNPLYSTHQVNPVNQPVYEGTKNAQGINNYFFHLLMDFFLLLYVLFSLQNPAAVTWMWRRTTTTTNKYISKNPRYGEFRFSMIISLWFFLFVLVLHVRDLTYVAIPSCYHCFLHHLLAQLNWKADRSGCCTQGVRSNSKA